MTTVVSPPSAMIVSVARGFVELSDYLPYIDDSSSERADDSHFAPIQR